MLSSATSASFNIDNWLNTDFAEDIVYITSSTSATIQALVTRPQNTQFSIKSGNNQILTNNTTIEISIDDILTVNASRSNGDKVILFDLKGKLETFNVVNIVCYDQMCKSWKLELSK